MTVFKNRLMKNSSIIATLLLIILIATASFLSGRKIYSMERQRNLELLPQYLFPVLKLPDFFLPGLNLGGHFLAGFLSWFCH